MTLDHIFGLCKSIISFSHLTGSLTKPDHSLAILHLGIDLFPHNYKTVVIHVLLSAKIIIARHWKQDHAPNFSKVVNLIIVHYFKTMYPHKANTRSTFDARWKPWVEISLYADTTT